MEQLQGMQCILSSRKADTKRWLIVACIHIPRKGRREENTMREEAYCVARRPAKDRGHDLQRLTFKAGAPVVMHVCIHFKQGRGRGRLLEIACRRSLL